VVINYNSTSALGKIQGFWFVLGVGLNMILKVEGSSENPSLSDMLIHFEPIINYERSSYAMGR